jgi:hypothetical protein
MAIISVRVFGQPERWHAPLLAASIAEVDRTWAV